MPRSDDNAALENENHRPDPDCLTKALDYATNRGWWVVAIPAGTKEGSYRGKDHPGSTGERWDASNDPNRLKQYWQTWPRANLGVVTGRRSGIFVIETDTIAGHPNQQQEGEETLRQLETKYGELPESGHHPTMR